MIIPTILSLDSRLFNPSDVGPLQDPQKKGQAFSKHCQKHCQHRLFRSSPKKRILIHQSKTSLWWSFLDVFNSSSSFLFSCVPANDLGAWEKTTWGNRILFPHWIPCKTKYIKRNHVIVVDPIMIRGFFTALRAYRGTVLVVSKTANIPFTSGMDAQSRRQVSYSSFIIMGVSIHGDIPNRWFF